MKKVVAIQNAVDRINQTAEVVRLEQALQAVKERMDADWHGLSPDRRAQLTLAGNLIASVGTFILNSAWDIPFNAVYQLTKQFHVMVHLFNWQSENPDYPTYLLDKTIERFGGYEGIGITDKAFNDFDGHTGFWSPTAQLCVNWINAAKLVLTGQVEAGESCFYDLHAALISPLTDGIVTILNGLPGLPQGYAPTVDGQPIDPTAGLPEGYIPTLQDLIQGRVVTVKPANGLDQADLIMNARLPQLFTTLGLGALTIVGVTARNQAGGLAFNVSLLLTTITTLSISTHGKSLFEEQSPKSNWAWQTLLTLPLIGVQSIVILQDLYQRYLFTANPSSSLERQLNEDITVLQKDLLSFIKQHRGGSLAIAEVNDIDRRTFARLARVLSTQIDLLLSPKYVGTLGTDAIILLRQLQHTLKSYMSNRPNFFQRALEGAGLYTPQTPFRMRGNPLPEIFNSALRSDESCDVSRKKLVALLKEGKVLLKVSEYKDTLPEYGGIPALFQLLTKHVDTDRQDIKTQIFRSVLRTFYFEGDVVHQALAACLTEDAARLFSPRTADADLFSQEHSKEWEDIQGAIRMGKQDGETLKALLTLFSPENLNDFALDTDRPESETAVKATKTSNHALQTLTHYAPIIIMSFMYVLVIYLLTVFDKDANTMKEEGIDWTRLP